MRGVGDYQVRLVEVKGTFYNGVQVRADGQARLGQVAKCPRAGGGWQYYVEAGGPDDVAGPWVPAGWERFIVRALSASR